MHKESSGTIDFVKKLVVLLAGTRKCIVISINYVLYCYYHHLITFFLCSVGCTIAIGVTIVVPVAMFLVGLRYLNECPLNVFIPVYLLVGGDLKIKDNC